MKVTTEELSKIGFVKTEKNKWVYWDDYILDDINPEYGYFLYVTVSFPKKDWGSLEYNFSKIILHRHYNYEMWCEMEDYYDCNKIYEGNIDSIEDLEWLLNKTGIKLK